MEFTIKPFSEVVAEVDQRIEHTKSLGPDAPIRHFSDIYVTDTISDAEQFQLLQDTLSNEITEISLFARSKGIKTIEKHMPYRLKRVSGWILGSEVLAIPKLGDRNQLQLTGMFLAEEDVLIANYKPHIMGPKNIPSNSAGYNSKRFTEEDTAKILKYSGLVPINFTPESLTVGTAIVAREYLAEFALKHSIQDKLKLN